MVLLLDIFGFLSVILAGIARTAQAIYLGSLIFMIALAGIPIGETGKLLVAHAIRDTRRIAVIGLAAMIVAVLACLALHVAILSEMTDGDPIHALGSDFSQAQLARIGIGLAALVLLAQGASQPLLLLTLTAVEIGAGVATSHAVARLDDRLLLIFATGLHQFSAAVWIGGMPALLLCLHKITDSNLLQKICRKYSDVAVISVGAIFGSGAIMLIAYVGSPEALYGTAYGMMLGTKLVLFLTLFGLGTANFFVVRGMSANGFRQKNRLMRFVEVELGIGITVFFVAASITSLPPAIDLVDGRASLGEIRERFEPRWPDLTQPGKDHLGIERVQNALDAMTMTGSNSTSSAYSPGAKATIPRNADDILWSEYNHHTAGLFVLLIGILAVLERTGRARWARHWPLLFIGLAWFLFARSESEAWPIGTIPFTVAISNPEYVQHRLFMLLMTGFGLFEWSVRTDFLRKTWARYVFPVCCSVGGLMLLTHSHSITNVKELLLIEMPHMPLAVFGIWAGWARWLELRLDGPIKGVSSWTWPIMLCLVGLTLLIYRET